MENFRISPGREPSGPSGSSLTADTTTRPRTASSQGVPEVDYTPSPYQILQPPGYVVDAVRADVVAADPVRRTPPPPGQHPAMAGDSVGRWEGDTLVVETKNLNGKTWLNEVGEVVSHAADRGRAVHADQRRPHHLPGDGDRSDRVHASVDDRDSVEQHRMTSSSKSRVKRTTRTCRI